MLSLEWLTFRLMMMSAQRLIVASRLFGNLEKCRPPVHLTVECCLIYHKSPLGLGEFVLVASHDSICQICWHISTSGYVSLAGLRQRSMPEGNSHRLLSAFFTSAAPSKWVSIWRSTGMHSFRSIAAGLLNSPSRQRVRMGRKPKWD